MSIAPMDPPARPIAVVTSPRTPGSLSSRTRSVRLKDALGVMVTDPCFRWRAARNRWRVAIISAQIRRSRAFSCRGKAVPRFIDLMGGPRTRALPDRRQQPGLPGVLRAARVDRHLARRADQRDL